MPYVLITRQPRAVGAPETNVYGPGEQNQLEQAGRLLADGASPPMTLEVLPLQAAKWDEL